MPDYIKHQKAPGFRPLIPSTPSSKWSSLSRERDSFWDALLHPDHGFSETTLFTVARFTADGS
jgi:hypothetical protein